MEILCTFLFGIYSMLYLGMTRPSNFSPILDSVCGVFAENNVTTYERKGDITRNQPQDTSLPFFIDSENRIFPDEHIYSYNIVHQVHVVDNAVISIDVVQNQQVDLIVKEVDAPRSEGVIFHLESLSPYPWEEKPSIALQFVHGISEKEHNIRVHVNNELPSEGSYSHACLMAAAVVSLMVIFNQGEIIYHRKKKKRKLKSVLQVGSGSWGQRGCDKGHRSSVLTRTQSDGDLKLIGNNMEERLGIFHNIKNNNNSLSSACSEKSQYVEPAKDTNSQPSLCVVDQEYSHKVDKICTKDKENIQNESEKEIKCNGPELLENDHAESASPLTLTQRFDLEKMLEITRWLKSGVSQCIGNHMKSSIVTFPKKHKAFLLCLLFTLSIVAVYASTNGRTSRHLLTIFLPQKTLVRHIRSYSANPDLSKVSINTSSLSLTTRVQLIDMADSCRHNLTSCQTHALCEVGFGSMKCRCGRGFYLKDKTCHACTTNVPEGYYMLESCTTARDVVFRPCTKCEGSTYEVAACTTTQDTMCLDVSFPMNHFKWDASYLYKGNSSIDISTTNNVFLEKLNSLETVDYKVFVGNNQQSNTFPFQRKSGLEVMVKVSGIFLVPEYVDIDHLYDDSRFMQMDVSNHNKMKRRFTEVQKKYCRHPVPDHYRMVLFVKKNFTSAAQVVTCSGPGKQPQNCPMGYDAGEKYLDRFFSIPCPEMPNINYSAPKQPANAILCSGSNALLKETFKLRPAEVMALTFPTEECRQYQKQCEDCLARKSCSLSAGIAGESCCSLSCYTSHACERAYSLECPPKPVQCAAGDLYQVLIEPVFGSLQEKFMCHVEYKPPRSLYRVEYSVQIPTMNFTTSLRSFEVYAPSKEEHQFAHGSKDFINYYHSLNHDIQQEAILIGRNFNKDNEVENFYFHKLKEPHEFVRNKERNVRKSRSHDLTDDIYSTDVQLEHPFLFTSSNFKDGGCLEKNFSKVYPIQDIYGKGRKISPSRSRTDMGMPKEYQAVVDKNAPIITFIIHGNQSVLNHYSNQELANTHLITNTLKAKVHWNLHAKRWDITIKGTLSVYPGYLTMDVFDKFMTSHLGHYDVLVVNKATFRVTIHVQPPSTDMPDIFVINLNDTTTCHRLLVSLLDQPVQLSLPLKSDAEAETGLLIHHPWVPIIIMTVITFMVVVVCLFGFFMISRIQEDNTSFVTKQAAFSLVAQSEDTNAMGENMTRFLKQSKSTSRLVVIALVALYILYALIFTFSMLILVFYLVQGPLISNLTIVSNTSAKFQEAVRLHLKDLQEFEVHESYKMLNETHSRVRACSNHLKSSAEDHYHKIYKEFKTNIHRLYKHNGTLHKILVETLEDKSVMLRDQLSMYYNQSVSKVNQYFDGYLSIYQQFLKEVVDRQWLTFPRSLYMDQNHIMENQLRLQQDIVDFLDWLEIQKVPNVLSVKDKVIQRLDKYLPKLSIDLPLKENLGVSLEQLNAKNSIRSSVFQKHQVLSQQTYIPGQTTLSNSSKNLHEPNNEQDENKQGDFNKLMSILLPVFIVAVIFFDILTLLYRFTWLVQVFRKAKLGAEEKIPTDHVAKKIHFALTGCEPHNPYETLDNPFQYYLDNMESFWKGNQDKLVHFKQAGPKAKEDILRQVWKQKKRAQEMGLKTEPSDGCFFLVRIFTTLKFCYKNLIAPFCWRFVLVGVFIIIIIVTIKTTDDLMTLDTVTFLMDARSTIPQFYRQIALSNQLLSDFHAQTNIFLQEFQSSVKGDVRNGTLLLWNVIHDQNVALREVLESLCNNRELSMCNQTLPNVHLREALTPCNLLPVGVHFYQGFNEEQFMHRLHIELLPLVSTLRQLFFNSCYLLYAYACFMLFSHMVIRVTMKFLTKTNRIPTNPMFLISNANDCWKSHRNEYSAHSKYNRSDSWVESCESGVVGDMDDTLREHISHITI